MKKILKTMMAVSAVAVLVFAMGVIVSAAEATVTVPTMYYGNEAGVTNNYTYTNASLIDSNESGLIIPIKVTQPGTLKITLNYTKLEKYAYSWLYTDEACTNYIASIDSANPGDVQKEEYISVTNAGTYYFKIYTNSYSDSEFTNSFSLTVNEYTTADKTIKSGQTITYYRNNANDYYWFKYKAEKTGKVTVDVTKIYGSYITLTNSKKKALTEEEYVSQAIGNFKQVFTVKKGTTYYFRVRAIGSDDINTFSVKNTAIKEKSGAKKKKAVNIKSKKKVKGTILPGNKTADWYKFTVKKKKAVTFNLDGDVTGSINFTVYTKSGKKVGSYSWNGGQDQLKLTYSTSYGKVNKGTYYIKISRGNSMSSGNYVFNWK